MINPSQNFWANRRVLVTGHSGFKGSWLTLWLNQMGAEVLGLSLDDRANSDLFLTAKVGNRCSSLFADLNDIDKWSREISNFDPEIVFHLAAQSLVREGYETPVKTFDTNVLGTVRLLEALRYATAVKSIVIVTTDKVYRDVHVRRPFNEDDHLGGHDPYSASKAACEIAVATYRKSFFEPMRIAVSTARAGNVIGGGDWSADRLIPDAVRAWSKGSPLIVRNPSHTRPWQHVLEPLCGYLILAEKTFEDASLAQPFNFGPLNENDYSVESIISLASNFFDASQIQFQHSNNHRHESEWLNLNSDLAFEMLNYKARLSIEETVTWTMDWYKKSLLGFSSESLCDGQIKDYLALATVSR
jgi:CDP-glucose 4,6-dehydratase